MERSAGRTRNLGTRRDPFDAFGFGPFVMIRRMQKDNDRLFGGFGTSRGSLAPFGREIGDWPRAIDVKK